MSSVKRLFLGIALIILVGIGGLVYRNAVERPSRPLACPLDKRVCPDGTTLAREGGSCAFPACPLPNITLDAVGIAFALPPGFAPSGTAADATVVATYEAPGPTPSEPASIVIRRYPVEASSTALATIQATAIGGASGAPVPATAYSSTDIRDRQFTVVGIERFEAVVTTAYYLVRGRDVLRFDATDRGVVDWTNSALDVGTLPAHAALRHLLSTLQAE